MKRLFFVAIAILLFFFIEIFISTNFQFLKNKPNLLLLAAVFFTIYFGLAEGLFSAVICGILSDAFSLNSGATNFLSFVICVILINYFKKYLYRETIPTIFVTALAASLLNLILDYALGLFMKGVYLGGSFLWVIVCETVITTILAPLVFVSLKRCALKFYM